METTGGRVTARGGVETITLPALPGGEIPYDELLAAMKRDLDTMPERIRALLQADPAGWQKLLDEIVAYVENKPELKGFIQATKKDGQDAIAIGDSPQRLVVAVFALYGAFQAGYAIGTLLRQL